MDLASSSAGTAFRGLGQISRLPARNAGREVERVEDIELAVGVANSRG